MSLRFPRRELFDVRMQLMEHDHDRDDNDDNTEEFVNAASDLVDGVYEGGLKTWECSIDLATFLHRTSRSIQQGNVLEVYSLSLSSSCLVFNRWTIAAGMRIINSFPLHIP